MSAPVALGPNSSRMICPSCHATIATRVEKDTSMKTHLAAIILCFFGCCCIPYCIDTCKVSNHHCPSCGAFLGSYNN